MILLLPPGSIIVMDNALVHYNLGIERVLEARQIKIEWLPPYSLDFNPIEQTFNTLKQWVKRHIDEAQHCEDFGEFMRVAVVQAVGDDARKYFKESGYGD